MAEVVNKRGRRWRKKKITKKTIIDIGVMELGMTYDELMHTTPEEMLRLNAIKSRERERMWEQTRAVMSAIYSVNSKNKVKPEQIIKLSIDEERMSIDISEEEIDKTLRAWKLKDN